MDLTEKEAIEFDFIAGDLSLDFTNTVNNRRSTSQNEELFKDYASLLAWALQASLLSDQQFDTLFRLARRRPREAEIVVGRARALREAVYRIVLASFTSDTAQAADMELLNTELALGLPNYRLAEAEGRYTWKWEYPAEALDPMLGPVAWSAAGLLTSEELDLVRECAGDDCGWLFVDRTRNHSRRWCDMKVCGNVAKVRSFRTRKKEEVK